MDTKKPREKKFENQIKKCGWKNLTKNLKKDEFFIIFISNVVCWREEVGRGVWGDSANVEMCCDKFVFAFCEMRV